MARSVSSLFSQIKKEISDSMSTDVGQALKEELTKAVISEVYNKPYTVYLNGKGIVRRTSQSKEMEFAYSSDFMYDEGTMKISVFHNPDKMSYNTHRSLYGSTKGDDMRGAIENFMEYGVSNSFMNYTARPYQEEATLRVQYMAVDALIESLRRKGIKAGR